MSTIAALWYADRRVIGREFTRILRSPGRLSLWLLFAIAFAINVAARYLVSPHVAHAVGPMGGGYSRLAVSVLFAGLGFSLIAGRPACLRDRAEALLLARNRGSQRIVIAYLALRWIPLSFGRQILGFAFLLVNAFPYGSPAALTRNLLFTIAILIALAAFALPRAVARGFAVIGYQIAGAIIAAVAVLGTIPAEDPIVRSLPFVHAIRERIPYDFPNALTVTASGDVRPIFAMIALAATAVALFVATSGDAYPELYAVAEARLAASARRRGRTSKETTVARRAIASHVRAPRGLLAIVWKGAIEAWRQPHALWFVLGALAAGAVTAYLTQTSPSVAPSATMLILQLIVLDGVARPSDFVREFRLPLFRLSAQPLLARLAMLALAHSFSKIVLIWCFAGGLFAFDRSRVAIGLLAGAPVFLYLVSSASFALIALFPSPVDRRGPVLMLRYIAILIALLPPATAAVVIDLVLHLPIIAAFAAAGVALFEALALVALAAWRIDGRFERLIVAG